ncbi:DUF6443 domain-containing protein [Sinomicrobium sp. M5D2P9]
MKKIFILLFLLPLTIMSQSDDKNYIKQTAYQVKTTDGIHKAGTTTDLLPDDIVETVNYFDGLGRAVQSVNQRAGGQNQDVITHIEYDEYGRQIKEFLPYVSSANGGMFRTDALNNTNSFYNTSKYGNTSNPFSEKVFETSPVNRIIAQAAPGNDWEKKTGGNSCFDSSSSYYNSTVCVEYRNSVYNNVPSGYGGCYDPDYWGYDEPGCVGIRVSYPLPPSPIESDNYGHTIQFDNQVNLGNVVRRFEVNLSLENNIYIPTLTGGNIYYNAETLYKTIIKDENWIGGTNHTIEEFKDKQGHVVLKRTYADVSGVSTPHDTYYIYDDYGNLTYVLPPNAMEVIAPGNIQSSINSSATVENGSSLTLTASNSIILSDGFHAQSGSIFTAAIDNTQSKILDELCYQYIYDSRNRLVEKKLPGKGWEYIVYNMLDRPVLTQDTKLQVQNKWLFTKYDVFGRVAYTGTLNHTGSRTALQNSANNITTYDQYEVRTPTANTYAGTPVYYSNEAIPKGLNDEILTINYYDNYTFDLAGLTVPTTVLGQTVDTRTKTLATGSKTRVLGTNHWITTISAYDKKGRLIYTATKNPYLNTTDIVESKLDFAGKVLETRTTHTKGSNAAIVTIDKFEYDHMGRLLVQTQKINNQSEELIAENVYDELGQLEQKKVGNTQSNPLQTTDYKYNVRGWLTDINDVDNPGDRLFNFQINYNISRSGTVAPLFNGNIAETYWKTANDNTMRRYAYTYDALNRITSGKFNGGGQTDRYTVKDIAYDKNGNIMKLQRTGAIVATPVQSNAANFGPMDNLTYEYNAGNIGNKLLKVTDSANKTYGFKDGTNTNNDYTYDTNGNLLTDANKGITGVTYNYLNLPTQISFGSNKIAYIYDALGIKLKKEVTQGSSVTRTEYAGNYIYENGSLAFFSHPEGYVTKENNTYKYVYQYKDHLGNARLSYANIGTTSSPQLEIIEENNYYPFGLEHKGYNNVVNGPENNYKTFQDQEFTENLGLNMHEFTFRMYDPVIGRFAAIDPIADSYPHNGTYNFSENRPIDGIELEGLEYVSRIHLMDGDKHIATLDINYYQMTEEQIEAAGGTYQGVYNAASYGPEGKGVKHTYFNVGETENELYQNGNIRWDFGDDKTRHGLYSGAGSITDYRGGDNYDFSFQPIDLADAIAKEHDINYANVAGSNYKGFAEDTRTLGADNIMVNKVNGVLGSSAPLARQFGLETPFRGGFSGEMYSALAGQSGFIGTLANYKGWKTSRMQSLGLSPDKPQDMAKVSILKTGDFLRYSANRGFGRAAIIRAAEKSRLKNQQ